MDFTECYRDTVSSVAAAARDGNRRRLRRLIKAGLSVDCRDNRGWLALHEAAAAGSDGCVRELLAAVAAAGSSSSRRAYVNGLSHEGESACYLAAQRGHLKVVRLLLKAHADVDQLTNDLSCPLYAAVDGGHKDVVELLVREGAEVNRIHTASCWTSLHQAVYKGHSEIVRLLAKLCNLEAVDDHRISPLFVASQYGQQECLEILVNAGANVNTQAADLATPLFISAQEGHGAAVDFLLDHGADPNMACSQDWAQLPIHAAAEFGHCGILRRLIAATDRACDRTPGMVSPLYLAVHAPQNKSIEMLLMEGFSPDAQDCTDTLAIRSPLSLALSNIFNPCSETVKLLIAAGATLREEDWFYAFATDKPGLLQLILEHRWIPRPQSESGDSAPPGPGEEGGDSAPPGPGEEGGDSAPPGPGEEGGDSAPPGLREESHGIFLPRVVTLTVGSSRPRGEGAPRVSFISGHGEKKVLKQQELRELLCVALSQVECADCWLPLLLTAGLEPALLLQPVMLEEAHSEVLNYLLEFINWSTMAVPLREILCRRRAEMTWTPRPHFETPPSLSHICRLQVRAVMGPDVLMGTSAVQLLPVPPLLQAFLQFKGVSLSRLSPRLRGFQRFRLPHQHRHVL
ncbi:ankyrin repeat and SOCS box protein 3 [Aulostomus maculatus]